MSTLRPNLGSLITHTCCHHEKFVKSRCRALKKFNGKQKQKTKTKERWRPLLDPSTCGECMVPITNIKTGTKELTHGYQDCNTSQILIFGGFSRYENFLCILELLFGSIPMPGKFLGIVGQDPSDSKPTRLHVDIV